MEDDFVEESTDGWRFMGCTRDLFYLAVHFYGTLHVGLAMAIDCIWYHRRYDHPDN